LAQVKQERHMANILRHRKTNIVTLENGDIIADWHTPGAIVIVQEKDGWWTRFIGEDGEIHNYDEPFESYNKALWAAKAAAEFSGE
jgi:hypothetical protein